MLNLIGRVQFAPPARLGCYSLDGKDIEFTGVQPDVKVLNQFDENLKGNDTQLDKVIDVILGRLHKSVNN
jgi:C-terminal processing protease CtpA/Prc